MDAGGAETFLMKLYRAMDRTAYQMDFCVSIKTKGFYDDEIESMGGRIFRITPKTEDIGRFRRELENVVREGGYKYVLRITSNGLGFLDLMIAKKAGAEICSARSSNSSDGSGVKAKAAHILGRLLYSKYVDVKIAPSDLAGEYSFGKKAVERGEVIFLNNGIDLERFSYSEEGRRAVRKELGLSESDLVIGHIGRFNVQKNHGYLLRIFAKLIEEKPEAKLLLVGGGELEQEIRERVSELKIADSVIFAGIRKDVPELLSAMDVFVLPSLYEGMPNTVIEAQAVGVPCVISDTITREANVTGNVEYLSIELAPESWAQALCRERKAPRGAAAGIMRERGYSIYDARDRFIRAVFGENERE
jgi:glycosyltransferase involved in cell wall biosynthesis